MSDAKFTNALIHETSPYLLQHAHNPVEWHPWGEEALAKARKEDKPILLSIGYSACHWCHVMAHESFEDEETARLMNEHFVNIKVDREERPDLDTIYMTSVQLTTGSGGWPMTVFLTPDQRPFYCGTYFPKDDRYGMPGFRKVLTAIAKAYREQREAVSRDAEAISGELRKAGAATLSKGMLDRSILDMAAAVFRANYDSRYGGFGKAPKFPPAMTLGFLMRNYLRTSDRRSLEMVERTLDAMASGGMYDQLGGGFHRYSVDARWLVPHFEKMLYDNALLGRAYLDAFLLTGDAKYRVTCEEILAYVQREMTSPEGGFYSSQDADSEGKEGEFFIWTVDEVTSLLGEDDGPLFCRYYGMVPGGNFEGRNILNIPNPVGAVAQLSGVSEERLLQAVTRGKEMLFKEREKRVRPGLDDKILTSWNGLMLGCYAEAAAALDSEEYRLDAVRNAEFLLSKLCRDGGVRDTRELLRSYKDGDARFNGYLDDYAFVIDGLISLYQAVFDPRWIDEATRLAETMVRKFWDEEGKGFYFTANDHENLIHRPKEFSDNAIPSGNSVAAGALLRLSRLTGDERWTPYAMSILEGMTGMMSQHPAAFPYLLSVLDGCLTPPIEIAVIGDPGGSRSRELLNEVFRRYRPNKVVACGAQGGLPILEDRPQIDGHATAYVCESSTCRPPVVTPAELSTLLR